MSLAANKRLVRRFIEDVVNSGDVTHLAEFVSPDFREPLDTTGQSRGLEGMKRHVLAVRQTFPDLQLTVDRQIAEGEWVATCVTARGTHAGAWIGMAPTGQRVEITAVNVDRVVAGRILEHEGAANMLEALLSIGAVAVVGERA
jgi:predicted ester cyclase